MENENSKTDSLYGIKRLFANPLFLIIVGVFGFGLLILLLTNPMMFFFACPVSIIILALVAVLLFQNAMIDKRVVLNAKRKEALKSLLENLPSPVKEMAFVQKYYTASMAVQEAVGGRGLAQYNRYMFGLWWAKGGFENYRVFVISKEKIKFYEMVGKDEEPVEKEYLRKNILKNIIQNKLQMSK